MKLKIDAGLLWDSVDRAIYLSGPFINLEPKLKTSKNTVLGLRLGAALNTQRILTTDPSQFIIFNDMGYNSVISFVPALDYYFTKSKFQPYIGAGAGYNLLTTTKKGIVIRKATSPYELNIKNRGGLLLRSGFELNHFSFGLDFNYIPKAYVEMFNGQKIGTIVTSNVALSIGYTIDSVNNQNQG